MISKSDYDITEAIRLFNNFGVEATYIVPTAVGLGKSIMDATSPLRSYLKINAIHDYEGQLQGPEGKKVIPIFLINETNLTSTTASLYRPKAKGKEGDPRIWFSKLSSYASPNNLLGVIAFCGALYVVNLSKPLIRESVTNPKSPLGRLLREIDASQNTIANELLEKIKEIAALGWIQTVTPGDTGVGATLEKHLGIQPNSSRNPDYKGIEIKAKRLRGPKPNTRNTLFTKVPDWSISRLKSSAEILDSFGYFRDNVKKLNCTVKSSVPNSQGLMLRVDELNDLLQEVHQISDQFEDVVSWKFDVLRDCLRTKHNETFWVRAATKKSKEVELFQYKQVIHTRRPFISNFHTLCHEGVITLDHLIKRNIDGKVRERGPSFKIDESNLELLFPPPVVIDLT